jgi:1-acyl-sn-glycerol-3-phosphate acyltransferase
MTKAAMKASRTRPAPDCDAVPRRSDVLFRGFRWWVRGYLKKHFHAVRLSCGSRPNVSPELPLVIVLNHPSWWDPLVGVFLAGLFPERVHYAPMESKALARYKLFEKLGFYGVEPGTARGGISFLKTTTAILSQPCSAVWITAQGRFADPRVRPPELLPGVGHVARRLSQGVIITVALEYPFWEERLPEALVRFGEPIVIERGETCSASDWVKRIEENLSAAQDALMADALRRDPTAFESLLTGKVAIGGIYDRWRRILAWRSGQAFQAEHGSERR